MPAAKKHVTTRARGNTASSAATLSDGVVVLAPSLPPRPAVYDREGMPTRPDWQQGTKDWWADLWASPMAAEYHSSDKHALFILAVLIDDFWSNPSQNLAAEIRLQRVAFGMTPYDRRRLEWTIEATEDAKDRGKNRRNGATSQQPKPGDDARLVLIE